MWPWLNCPLRGAPLKSSHFLSCDHEGEPRSLSSTRLTFVTSLPSAFITKIAQRACPIAKGRLFKKPVPNAVAKARSAKGLRTIAIAPGLGGGDRLLPIALPVAVKLHARLNLLTIRVFRFQQLECFRPPAFSGAKIACFRVGGPQRVEVRPILPGGQVTKPTSVGQGKLPVAIAGIG